MLDDDQNLWRKQRTWGATEEQALQEVPRDEARAAPSTRAVQGSAYQIRIKMSQDLEFVPLCWLATVKKELPLTSSQRSKPVLFLSGLAQCPYSTHAIHAHQYWPT